MNKKIVASLVTMAIVAMSVTPAAFAATSGAGDASLTVNAGSLTLTVPATYTLSTASVNAMAGGGATDQTDTFTGANTVSLVDARGDDSGFILTVTEPASSLFTGASTGDTFDANLRMNIETGESATTGAVAAEVTQTTAVTAVNGTTGFTLYKNGVTADQSYLNVAFPLTFTYDIDANILADTYTSTLTFTLNPSGV